MWLWDLLCVCVIALTLLLSNATKGGGRVVGMANYEDGLEGKIAPYDSLPLRDPVVQDGISIR